MASTFPAAIANEPPPLDASSEDEDSEDYRPRCLNIDNSGEPTPDTTPFKRPQVKFTGKSTEVSDSGTGTPPVDNIEEDAVLEINSSSPKANLTPIEISSPSGKDLSPKDDSDVDFQFENDIDTSTDEELSGADAIGQRAELDVPQRETEHNEEEGLASPQIITTITSASNSAANLNTSSNDCDISQQNVDKLKQEFEAATGTDKTVHTSALPSSIDENNEIREINDNNGFSESVIEDNVHSSDTSSSSNNENEVTEPSEVGQQQDESPPSDLRQDSSDLEFGDFNQSVAIEPNANTLSPTTEIQAATAVEEDFDDDDFGAFQSIPSGSLPITNKQELHVDDDNDDDDDDFGDFAQVPAPAQLPPPQTVGESSKSAPPLTLSAQTSFSDSGDFADFKDCSFQSSVANLMQPQSMSLGSDITRISAKVETVIKSLFVIDSNLPEEDANNEETKLKSIDNEIGMTNDNLWASVQDFEGSKGLMFKWLNCLTEKHLLKSLNIDNSNIMYHEKWGTIEVPKFAASLVQSPLQPQSCVNQIDPQMKTDAHHSLVNNNNNNVTDEGITCQDHDKPPTISVESQEILRQLPDLSYMRANTLVFPQPSPSGIDMIRKINDE